MIRSYSELCALSTFKERFFYLQLSGIVGRDTFGYDRYLNQQLYSSNEWADTRNDIIVRDLGCDLGCKDLEIMGIIIVHHINPITREDIIKRSSILFDHENLICTSINTHNAIHYGNEKSLVCIEPVIRKKNDTCPWKRIK